MIFFFGLSETEKTIINLFFHTTDAFWIGWQPHVANLSPDSTNLI